MAFYDDRSDKPCHRISERYHVHTVHTRTVYCAAFYRGAVHWCLRLTESPVAVLLFSLERLYCTPFSNPTVLSKGQRPVTEGHNDEIVSGRYFKVGLMVWHISPMSVSMFIIIFLVLSFSCIFIVFKKIWEIFYLAAIWASTKNPQNGSFGIKVCQIMPIHPDKPIQICWRCWNWFQAPLVKVSLKNKNL